jgi:hypothetical protein
MRARVGLAVAFTALAASVAACSGDDDGGGGDEPDGGALVDPFGEMADGFYAEAGSDRDEDFNQGALGETCPILADGDAPAIAEALGIDGADEATLDGGSTFVSGPPQRELMSCTIRLPDDGVVGISAGTTPVDRDGLLSEYRQNVDEDVETIDAEAPGLDPDHVIGILRDGDAPVVVWITGGFQVNLNVPDGTATADDATNALPVAVEAVATALG